MIKIPLRSDSFMFLRKVPVDLSRYLPYFLYNDEVFSKIQAALNREHESYRLKLQHLSQQLYHQTADSEGLKDWELFLKIPNLKGYDTELRRSVIATKLLRNTTMTVANTKKLMREFAPYGEVDIEELGENKLKLIINNGNFVWDELLAALWEWLPAHLIFSFSIEEDFGEETVHYAQATADATWDYLDLDMLSPPPEIVTVGIFPVDISTDTINIDSADEHSDHADFVTCAILTQAAEYTKIDCDRAEILDEDTIEDFERYIRWRWEQFKKNAVVKWYKHGSHGIDEGEIDNPDDPEYFPIDTDFLRIYWAFDCPNDQDGKGGKNYHLRYQTILKPRPDFTPQDINYLSAVGAAGKMLLHSKLDVPTSGIVKALYIKKTETKII